MAKYNLNNIQTDKDFLEFIKSEYGYNYIKYIPPF